MNTSTKNNRVEAGAEKRFFIEMLVKDIELLPAIVDLVDNSVDGARRLRTDGDFREQWVHIDVGEEGFSISDNSGGISADIARQYAFRFGRAKDFSGVKHSVGQFGVGMKRAIFKLGRTFSVESTYRSTGSESGSRFTLHVDVDEWEAHPEWTFQFESVSENIEIPEGETAGTVIKVKDLHMSVADDLGDPNTIRQLGAELSIRH